jgi:hypothetical protein
MLRLVKTFLNTPAASGIVITEYPTDIPEQPASAFFGGK